MSFKSASGKHRVKEEAVLKVENIITNNVPVFGTDGKMKDSGIPLDFITPPITDYTTATQYDGMALSPSDKQIVTLASGYEYLHGSCIVGNYLFAGCRKASGQPGRVIRFNLNDLTIQTLITFPDATYNGCEQLTYVPSKKKIYITHHSTGNDLYVTELDPETMVYTRVISDLAIGYKMYYPTNTSDGNYLYVISGVQTAGAALKIRKYDLTTYAFVSELDTGIIAGGHAVKNDGNGSLFVTTSYRVSPVQQYVLRIDLLTFTLVDQGALIGESYTDDLTIVGDYVYIGMEYIYNTVDTLTIARAKKNSLSTVDYLTIPTIKGSCYGMIYEGQYLWCLAATSPGNIIRINPETFVADIYTTPAGEEIPNEYLFNGKNHYFTYWQSPAKVARYSKLQYQQSIMLKPSEGIVSDFRLAPEDITRTSLATLITGNALIPSKRYAITDSTSGGKILVTASSINKLESNAIWLRNTNLKSFGWIRLTGGTSGSVNTITAAGVNQMSTTINYTTSLVNTASLVAGNINSNGSAGYTAVAMLDTIVLVAKTAAAAKNGETISGTATTITLGSIQNTVRGSDPVLYPLEIKYDLTGDVIISCYDPILNNRIEASKFYINYAIASLGASPILDFRWGDTAFLDNRVKKGYIKDVYIAGDNLFEANTCEDYSFIRNMIGTSSSYFGINSCYGSEAVVRNNLMIGTFTQIIRNEIRGPITNNILSGSQSKISTNSLYIKSDSTYIISGITGNTLSGSIALIAYNYLTSGNVSGSHTKISNNVLSASNAIIWGNILTGESSIIDGNTISIASGKIRNCRLTGGQTTISSNIISGGTNPGIYDCVLNGKGANINTNTISSTAATLNGIIDCTLNGVNSAISSCTVANSGFIGRITLDAPSASISGITTSTTIPRIENIYWLIDNTIKMRLLKNGINGTINNGQVGSNIEIGYIPVAKAYPVRATIEGQSLSYGVGARLQIGIETDDNQNIMIDTATSVFDNTIVAGIITLTKSTVTNRKIIIVPTGADITAGNIEIFVEFQKSNF